MISVDSSVWIDYLHKSDQALVDLLLADEVCVHPLVVEEIALGSIARREAVLAILEGLEPAEVISHEEALTLITERELWAKGLSAVDAHLLGSALRSRGGVQLWTRDKRLISAAEKLGVAYVP